MIFQNKINSKNAFDVDTDFINTIAKTIEKTKKDGESSWLRASASLDASAKIYGFRVDSVHTETYKVLGGLSRQNSVATNQQSQHQTQMAPSQKEDLFNMLAEIADEGGNSQSALRKGQKKGGISVQDLGYNVIFTGGERTLEKNPELTIDIQKFDKEQDPMFKDRTKKFDQGMLLNRLVCDKGLVLELDSETAVHCRKVLDATFSKLPRKGTSAALLNKEKERDEKMFEWNLGYVEMLKEETKFTQFYARNTLQEQSLPCMCAKLNSRVKKMFAFID